MILNCYFGNNNSFKLILTKKMLFGHLYFYISSILNIDIKNIVYIIYNNHIIDNNGIYKFNDSINIYANEINVYIIYSLQELKTNPSYEQYLEWYNSFYSLSITTIQDFQPKIISLNEEEYNDIINIINIEDINEEDKDLLCLCGLKLNDCPSGEHIAYLPCNHMYHNECIKRYLIDNSLYCPQCKYDLRDLIRIRNFGNKSLHEIKVISEKYNLNLK